MTASAEIAYGLHRRHAWTSLWAAALLAALLLVLSLIASGAWRPVCVLLGASLLWSVVVTARMLRDKRPILILSPDGLLYRPFANRVAPWSEITAIAFARSYSRFVTWGRVSWKRQTASDQIFFAVADPTHYPTGVGRSIMRRLQRLTGAPPIFIQLWLVNGDGEAICAEIAKRWPGQIRTIEQRLSDASNGRNP